MFFYFVTKHACDGQTDRQTDGQNYDPQVRASVASSRGKNLIVSFCSQPVKLQQSKIWRTGYLPHNQVHNDWTAIFLLPVWNLTSSSTSLTSISCKRENFGDSPINKCYSSYFSWRMRETAIFLLPIYNVTSSSCSSTAISYKTRELRLANVLRIVCINFWDLLA